MQHSILLFGPRGVGKTTFIQDLHRDHIFTVNLLDADTLLRYSRRKQALKEDVLQKIKTDQIRYCFIDEVQKIPELLDVVHDLIQSTHCQFLISGSSARKLKRSGVNLLAGRALQYYLYPFAYAEIKHQFKLSEVLQFGTLPSVFTAEHALKIKILQTYVNTYLREEIQAEGLVRNLGSFSRFLDVAASQCGDILSYQNVAQGCQVSPKTVQGYYSILEDTLVGFRLEPWLKSLKKRLVAHPKFYFFDTGVTNAINHRLTSLLDPQTTGRLFEQLLILETYRMAHYLGSEARLFYWRTEHGAEIDLLIEKHGQLTGAFEFKSTAEVSARDFSGLKAFGQEHSTVPRQLVYNGLHSYDAPHASVWTWQQFLEQLPNYL